jgi:hypothetical protein
MQMSVFFLSQESPRSPAGFRGPDGVGVGDGANFSSILSSGAGTGRGGDCNLGTRAGTEGTFPAPPRPVAILSGKEKERDLTHLQTGPSCHLCINISVHLWVPTW